MNDSLIEWFVPADDQAESEQASPRALTTKPHTGTWLTGPSVAWLTAQRATAGAVTGLMALAAVVAIHGQPAPPPQPAPRWSMHRPLDAALNPTMTAGCFHPDCSVRFASARNLAWLRTLAHGTLTVIGIRVYNARGQLRGVGVWGGGTDGSQLSIDAVWVRRSPTDWDGRTGNLNDGTAVGRWVVRSSSGYWLVECQARPAYDGRQLHPSPFDALVKRRIRAEQFDL